MLPNFQILRIQFAAFILALHRKYAQSALFIVQHGEGVHACGLRKRGQGSNGYQEEQSCRSERKGPEIKRRNVELVQVTGPASVAMRVHERGSGETRSCGTGAVAAAAAAATGSDGTWDVRVPGGDLKVTLEGGRAWLTGPAVIVAEGELDPSWLATGHLASAGTVPRR